MRISDWSSDVCSSDLSGYAAYAPPSQRRVWGRWAEQDINGQIAQASHPHPQAVFGVPGDSEHDGVDVVIADERLQIHPTAQNWVGRPGEPERGLCGDRKSTRLNSSH